MCTARQGRDGPVTGITLDRLRADRHQEEALAYGPDPLRLARTFGISTSTGIRYDHEAKRLPEGHLSSHQADAKAPRT